MKLKNKCDMFPVFKDSNRRTHTYTNIIEMFYKQMITLEFGFGIILLIYLKIIKFLFLAETAFLLCFFYDIIIYLFVFSCYEFEKCAKKLWRELKSKNARH